MSKDEIRAIQLKCLEILEIVDYICEKHDIKYSLCGGSVVGAYLYKKCLPWDDDIDLMMTRTNYNRFLKVAPGELPEKYSIHNYQMNDVYWSPFTKIVDNETTLVQIDGTVSGVFLDITVYDKVPNDWKKNIDIVLWKVSQIVSIGSIVPRNRKDILRNILIKSVLRNERKYLKFFQWVVEKLGNARDYHYSELFGAYCNTKEYNKLIFENYTEIEFENKNYMIVRDYINYLETRYDRKDFREPKERQIAPHYQFVDLNKSYKKYTNDKKAKEVDYGKG